MRRWAYAAAWLLLFALCGIRPAAARPAAAGPQAVRTISAERMSRDWKQLRSRNFLAVGNATEEELRRAVTELEAFQTVLLEMFPSIGLASPVPTLIVVLKDNDTFGRFQPRDAGGRREEWVGGYFTALPDVNYMVTGWRGENGLAFDVVFHEFTHYVLNRNLSHVPLWLGEGVAEFYSTFRIDTAMNLTLVGETPALRLPFLRTHAPLPLERMLTNETAVQLFERDQDRAMFYAQSWALVHYLFLGQRGARTKQIGVYLDALEKGRTLDEAFTRAFECSKDELGRELTKYITDRKYPVLAIKRTGQAEGAGEVEGMREADAEALQADLLSRIGALDDAEKAANRALAVQPAHAKARVALARVRRAQDRRDEALAMLQAAAGEAGDDLAVRMELASTLLAARRIEEARAEAARAVAINGQAPSAHYVLALTSAAVGPEAEADAAMSKLLALQSSADYYRRRAYRPLRARAGRRRRARRGRLHRAGRLGTGECGLRGVSGRVGPAEAEPGTCSGHAAGRRQEGRRGWDVDREGARLPAGPDDRRGPLVAGEAGRRKDRGAHLYRLPRRARRAPRHRGDALPLGQGEGEQELRGIPDRGGGARTPREGKTVTNVTH